MTGRELIEEAVGARAAHDSREAVSTTISFANAEQLIVRGHYGRFLIELLQNAADAWRAFAGDDRRSRVEIVIAEGPTLLVANEGDAFPADVVIGSIGHIGQGTKTKEQSIGHKGIGFKSVLDISSTPEIYSGLAAEQPELAVRFDRARALEFIRDASPCWPELAAPQIEGADGDEVSLVPVLRFPLWVEDLPPEVLELAERGFETVIRLPLDARRTLEDLRGATRGVTDEMLLLLGAFDEVVIDDRLGGKRTVISPQRREAVELTGGVKREEAEVLRDGEVSTSWLLHRKELPEFGGLAGEVVVGSRLGGPSRSLVAPTEGEPSAFFHLFFPTEIRSGLPFLLHGYFEVSAARTHFYDGEHERNELILDELSELVRSAVADMASCGEVDLAGLANMLGDAPSPEDALARNFLDSTLDLLDSVEWIPLDTDGAGGDRGLPPEVLADHDVEVMRKLRDTFPVAYVRKKVGLGVAAKEIDARGNAYLVSRHPDDFPSKWETIAELCRPGPEGAGVYEDEQIGFLALLKLFAALRGKDQEETDELLLGLRGDDESVLVPVAAGDGGVRLVSMPDPGEGVAGQRSRGVMARTRRGTAAGASLVPPASLELDFVPDGLLESEREIDDAKALGVRQFNVANVVDRLAGASEHEAVDGEIARFLWRLLTRESLSEFSIGAALARAREFDPAGWFWATASDRDRERQTRLRSLASVRVPAADGSWQPAGDLAFGACWAAAMESVQFDSPAGELRRRSYAALEVVSPDPRSMIAGPDVLLALLGDVLLPVDAESREPVSRVEWLHAFLLRLGVWETLPVEAFDDAGRINRESFPWSEDPLSDVRDESIRRQGWTFGEHWAGGEHRNVWVQRDFRFRWRLDDAGALDPVSTSRLLELAAPLYEQLRHLTVFCPKCRGHSATRTSDSSDDYPSLLTVELRTAAWVPAVRDDSKLADPAVAHTVWWSPSIPTGAALTQSPLRYLTLCDPQAEVGSRLRELVGIESLDDADADSLRGLLNGLREEFDEGRLEPDPQAGSGARRAFVGLHRLAYERLGELLAETEGDDADEEDADDEEPEDPSSKEVVLGGDEEEALREDVLCEVGDTLQYRPSREVFHDDGSFASYRRYFAGLPFVELAKEKGSVARRLGVSPFEVGLERRPSNEPEDVTDETPELLAERVPEFLAILVHHVLAGQTLDPDSEDFKTRARRLQQLRVMRVENLVIEARVLGTEESTTIGEHSEDELFLEDPATPHPVIYHDLKGEGWRDAFRRRLAPHIAQVIERPDYADIFALFLIDDSDVQREATLLERGITQAHVAEIRAALGVFSEGERRARRLWFGAVLALLSGQDAPVAIEIVAVPEALGAVGFSTQEATRLIERGGGDLARRDFAPGGALDQLDAQGVDLRALHEMLVGAGGEGLRIGVARTRLREWAARNGRAAATVLSEGIVREAAKAAVDGWRAPEQLEYTLDPAPAEWLSPVIASLQAAGFDPLAEPLAEAPMDELMRLSGFSDPQAFERETESLYDDEQRRTILAAAGASWRRQLRLLGILARTTSADGRAAIRRRGEEVDALLAPNPASPVVLRPDLVELLPGHPQLADEISASLSDSVAAPGANQGELLEQASEHGIDTTYADAVLRALQAPRNELARGVRESIETMRTNELAVAAPVGHSPPPPRERREKGTRKIRKIKVDGSADKRKRDLGDQGERWALAAMIGELRALDLDSRRAAIDSLVNVFEPFEGEPAEAARAHAEAARAADLDEDELIDELAGFLHVASHSDAFGFDMLGWIADAETGQHAPMLVEVKSSADGSFHLSPNEWACAEEFASDYCVVVVRRVATSTVPQRLDLLADPARLVADESLSMSPDGYVLGYVLKV